VGTIRGAAAFVGRSAELSALREAWARAVAGQPCWALVGGEAGVGKTRLVTEFADEVAATGARVLTGNCPPVAPGLVPFAPVVEVLREFGPSVTDGLVPGQAEAVARLLQVELPAGGAGSPGEADQARLLVADRGCRNAPGWQAQAYLRTAAAEASRLTGPGDPGLWRAAIEAWERVPAAHRVAYARLRLAEALLACRGQRHQAQAELAAAQETAARLGARALAEEAANLATRARLEPAAAAGAGPADRFGLTERERDVLALVCAGATNRQIAGQLFISPKTAGLHVSHILAKLGVTTRGEAAVLVHRLGLDPPAPAAGAPARGVSPAAR
jgi:DNA-binding CsgD family transcriptional regulator